LSAENPLLWLFPLDRPRHHDAASICLRGLLADYLGCAAAEVPLHTPSGAAPFPIDAGTGGKISFGISYAKKSLLVGLCKSRRIGVDLLEICTMADWKETSALYLGQAQTLILEQLPADLRHKVFAREWTRLEARGKCLGQPLCEYSPGRDAKLFQPAMECSEIIGLPYGLIGSIALGPFPDVRQHDKQRDSNAVLESLYDGIFRLPKVTHPGRSASCKAFAKRTG